MAALSSEWVEAVTHWLSPTQSLPPLALAWGDPQRDRRGTRPRVFGYLVFLNGTATPTGESAL